MVQKPPKMMLLFMLLIILPHYYCRFSRLRRVFDSNVALGHKKRNFLVPSFSCLSYVVDSYGFKPDTPRLVPLMNAPSPTNLHEFRVLLDALQYFTRFILSSTQCATSLLDIVSFERFSWSINHEKTFRTLLRPLQTTFALKPFPAE
ncbi:uncharacterized protein DEA37_0014556, partial [Paragonimus westermani]